VSLVTINADRHIDIAEHLISVAQFEELVVELNETHEWQSTIDRVINSIDQAANKCEADHLIARVLLTGKTTLTWRLRRDSDLLLNEIEARLDTEEHRWLDKLIINCELPTDKALNSDSGPQAELANLINEQIAQSSELLNDAKQTIDALFKSLPSELRSSFGENEDQLNETIKRLALQGSRQVAANLRSESTFDEQAHN